MHPLRKLRESGKPTAAQVSELLAENIVFNSPILVRPIEGREVCAAIFAQSSATRGSGTYTAEFKVDERTTFLRWVGTMDGHTEHEQTTDNSFCPLAFFQHPCLTAKDCIPMH